MSGLTRRQKHLMAAGMRWKLSSVAGMPDGLSSAGTLMDSLAEAFGVTFEPGELEFWRDELMADPDFREAYEAAASADTWREFEKRRQP